MNSVSHHILKFELSGQSARILVSLISLGCSEVSCLYDPCEHVLITHRANPSAD